MLIILCVCTTVSVFVGGVFMRVQQSVSYSSDLILYLFQQTKLQMGVYLLANSVRCLILMNPVTEADGSTVKSYVAQSLPCSCSFFSA